jgi:hypothetical protein
MISDGLLGMTVLLNPANHNNYSFGSWRYLEMSCFRALISGAVITTLLVIHAQAAVLTNIEGAVSLNSGNGFLPASIGSSLTPGDLVRTGNGSVTIVYDNGCLTQLGPHQVAVVLFTPPACNGGLKDGAAIAAAEPEMNPLLGAGLYAGGAILVGVFATNSSSPVSP